MKLSPEFSIFVFCDSDRHEGRIVAVTNFDFASGTVFGTRWIERPASRAGAAPGTGTSLLGDEIAGVGWADGPDADSDASRVRFTLECRKCGERGVTVRAREDVLTQRLNGFKSLGLSRVSLAALGASMNRSGSQ